MAKKEDEEEYNRQLSHAIAQHSLEEVPSMAIISMATLLMMSVPAPEICKDLTRKENAVVFQEWQENPKKEPSHPLLKYVGILNARKTIMVNKSLIFLLELVLNNKNISHRD